ncbi:histidine phosphatase family protein [Ruania halotolerans]|uniref:histidine phosphatase family protein n=1 Tax=Ruania halotolerans TaxID=2897773 RepID=UPI001E3AEDC3|nr:histidine phosphatase family protein [Ruania halotolerans]UFU04869.1 histidine phosphatase family protein [Ruania halotolerans]
MTAAASEALTAVLVRHGETPLTPHGAYSGSGVPGPSLTETGRAQAAGAARLVAGFGDVLYPDLAPPSAIIASPMVRTQETAAAVAGATGLSVRTDDRAAECNFGDWEGLTPAEIDVRWPGERQVWHTDGTIAAPGGGESTADVGVRTAELLADLRAEFAGQTVLVIAHAVSIRSMLGRALLAAPGGWWRLRLAPASTSVVQVHPDGFTQVLAAGLPCGA